MLFFFNDDPPRRRKPRRNDVPPRSWRGEARLERLMRPLSDWTEEDLQELVQQQRQEDGELEYKDSRALMWPAGDNRAREECLNEVSKDVSAFANSNGGLLIYGIAEKDHVPVRVDDGLDPKTHGREWLEDIIRGNLQDPPPDLKVYPIPVGSAGRTACVVKVPLLPRGCQARDGRYYRRRNFRVDRLDDWEVRELLSRSIQPKVALRASLVVETTSDARPLMLTLLNQGTTRVHDWQVVVEVPVASIAKADAGDGGTTVKTNANGSTYETKLYRFTNTYFVGALFPQDEHELLHRTERPSISVKLDDDHLRVAEELDLRVHWIVSADDLPAQAGSARIVDLARGPE